MAPLDARARLVLLLGLTVAHPLAHGQMVYLLACVTAVLALGFFRSFRRGLPVILLTCGALAGMGLLVWLGGASFGLLKLLRELLRWISLTVATVTLALSLDVFAFVTSLNYLRVPVRVALAFGVGLRFVPVLAEELRRLFLVQKQCGFVFSRQNLARFGVVGFLERKFFAVFVAILRRIDSLVISIGTQEIERRIQFHVFPKLTVLDLGLMGAALAVVVLAAFR